MKFKTTSIFRNFKMTPSIFSIFFKTFYQHIYTRVANVVADHDNLLTKWRPVKNFAPILFWYELLPAKLWFKMKSTTLWGDHFSAIYIKHFHKSEVLMKILRCHRCLNLNWIKSYDIKHKFFCIHFFFNFVRKNK